METLRRELEAKNVEARKLLDEKKVEESKVVMEEIRNLKETIKLREELEIEEKRDLEKQAEARKHVEKKEERKMETMRTENEIRAIMTNNETELRAMNTTAKEKGGYVVSKELVKEIVKSVKDKSEAYSFFKGFNVNGELQIPRKTKSGDVVLVDECAVNNTNSSEPTLDLVELGQHRFYREGAISQHMLNVEALDLKAFLLDDIAESMSDKIEYMIFNGTGTKQPKGILASVKDDNKIAVAKKATVTVEELKKCKAKLKKSMWREAKWFMNSDTLLAIDLLTDTTGRPMLQQDLSQATGYQLLGMEVVVTDVMPSINDGKASVVVVLATPQAYQHNTTRKMTLAMYNDSTFTRAGLQGYGCDMYFDGKVVDEQALASIVNKA